MSPSLYLDMLDETLGAGVRGLSTAFVDAQVTFVAGCQLSDGGFRGRQGGSDLYYTDFALRGLALLAPGHPAIDRATGCLERQTQPLSSIVECFSLLSVRRTLERRPTSNAKNSPLPPFRELPALKEQLYQHLLSKGGVARFEGDGRASAYHTFLAPCVSKCSEKFCPPPPVQFVPSRL